MIHIVQLYQIKPNILLHTHGAYYLKDRDKLNILLHTHGAYCLKDRDKLNILLHTHGAYCLTDKDKLNILLHTHGAYYLKDRGTRPKASSRTVDGEDVLAHTHVRVVGCDPALLQCRDEHPHKRLAWKRAQGVLGQYI